MTQSGIIKTFWGTHIDLDKIVQITDLRQEKFGDCIMKIDIQLRDGSLYVRWDDASPPRLGFSSHDSTKEDYLTRVNELYDDFIDQWKTFRTAQLVARNASPG